MTSFWSHDDDGLWIYPVRKDAPVGVDWIDSVDWPNAVKIPVTRRKVVLIESDIDEVRGIGGKEIVA